MGLESVTHISDLVATNPVGATDPKSQGDDHIRNIKSALKTDFPAIAGVVTSDHTELSLLDGATGLTGTGNTVRSANPTFTGTLTAATVAATTLTGAGAGITALNASNLGSGTVPDARFPATLPAASGANLTALPAANVSGSHTLPDGVLSTNVPLLNAGNAFTADQSVTKASAMLSLDATGATSALLRVKTNSTVRGYFGDASIITGAGSAGDLAIRAESGGVSMSGNAGASPFLALSSAGVVTTPNASASEVGFKGLPQQIKTLDYGFVLTDAGTMINQQGTSKTNTIPANGSVAFPIGTLLSVIASAATTVAITTDTMYLLGTGFGTSGSRTVAAGGALFALKVASTTWVCWGPGVS